MLDLAIIELRVAIWAYGDGAARRRVIVLLYHFVMQNHCLK